MPPPDATEVRVPDMVLPAARQPPPADRLPTLTEVVLLGGGPLPAEPGLAAAAQPESVSVPPASGLVEDDMAPPAEVQPSLEQGLSAASLLASALPADAAPDAHALTQQVLAELAPRIDALFEARLREALAPALARAADTLIRQSRDELTLVLGELVQDAVTRTLRHHRSD